MAIQFCVSVAKLDSAQNLLKLTDSDGLSSIFLSKMKVGSQYFYFFLLVPFLLSSFPVRFVFGFLPEVW